MRRRAVWVSAFLTRIVVFKYCKFFWLLISCGQRKDRKLNTQSFNSSKVLEEQVLLSIFMPRVAIYH